MKTVVVFGGSGIVGQTMRFYIPEGYRFIFCRKGNQVEERWRSEYHSSEFEGWYDDSLHTCIDLSSHTVISDYLNFVKPDCIVNMAGENNVDKVEQDPDAVYAVNYTAAKTIAQWCAEHSCNLVHVSTQAVFDGHASPYNHGDSTGVPVNKYGLQKLQAEYVVRAELPSAAIVRPTFVIGVRPFKNIGRQSPLESMLVDKYQKQVNDRYFSVVWSHDIAKFLCQAVASFGTEYEKFYLGSTTNVGHVERHSRYTVANTVSKFVDHEVEIEAVPHSHFTQCCERAIDTTYAQNSACFSVEEAVSMAVEEHNTSDDLFAKLQLEQDISLFTGISLKAVRERFGKGFQFNHGLVAQDFRQAVAEYDNEQLIDWYRTTDAYMWELATFHCDPGFNYVGMCKGIADTIKAGTVGEKEFDRVLVLGDGIGTLSGYLVQQGIRAVYHDLANSFTASFAEFRFMRHGIGMETIFGNSFDPIHTDCDCIVALDFFEHLPNVEDWLKACWASLNPGGALIARNAFGQGSGLDGSIPCHLPCNDEMEAKWDGLLKGIGFEHVINEWYRKPLEV